MDGGLEDTDTTRPTGAKERERPILTIMAKKPESKKERGFKGKLFGFLKRTPPDEAV